MSRRDYKLRIDLTGFQFRSELRSILANRGDPRIEYYQTQTYPVERLMSRQHHIENWQFAQLRTRLADQLAQFHPQLRKTLLRNLSESVVAVTLAR